MIRPLVITLALLSPSAALADEKEKEKEQKPQPVPTPAPKPPASPGWQAAGMGGPLFVWSAGATASVVASDQFAGRDQAGWLVTVAPRFAIERPPARLGLWLRWEPSLLLREAGAFTGADNDFDGKADESTSFVNQGSLGLRAGADSGPRLTVEGRSAHRTEAVFADQRGLTDHVETGGIATVALVAPQRAHMAASAAYSQVEFSRDETNPLYGANHTRMSGTFDADTRVLLRTTVGVRAAVSRAEYPEPPEARPTEEMARTIDTAGAALTIGAQVSPSLRVDLEAGAAQRSEQGYVRVLANPNEIVPYDETTLYTPVHARLTMDVKRRARLELAGGTTVQDSLWRGNHWVRVHSGDLRAGTPIVSGLDLGAHAGVSIASYPEKEYPDAAGQATGPLAQRVDTTFTGGASLSYHPSSRMRLAVAYDRIQRDVANFEQYEWEENRVSFSAFWAF